MNDRLNEITMWLSPIFRFGVLVVTFLVLFLVWNLTTDFYDMPKFLILVLFLGLLLLLSAIKYITEGKITLTITPIDLSLVALVIVAVISTYTSPSFYVSLYGSSAKIHESLIALVVYVLFYFVLVNNLKTHKDVRHIINLLLLGGIGLSVMSLLSYTGLKILPITWTQALNFTPVGTTFSLNSLLILLLPFPLVSILRNSDHKSKFVYASMLTLFGTVLALTAATPLLIVALIALALVFFASNPLTTGRNLPYLIGLLLIVGVIALLSFVPPVGQAKNPLYNQAQNFPREVQLGFTETWKIAISSFRDAPLWGTGPSTFIHNFTSYKPIEINSSRFWNVRFDQPFNEYLGILSTLGGFGFLAFIALTLTYLRMAFKVLTSRTESNPEGDLRTALAIAGILFFIVLALHASTLVLSVVGITLLASFMALNPQITKEVRIRLGSIKSSDNGSVDALPALFLVIVLISLVYIYYNIGKVAIADYHHRQALDAVARNNGLEAYNQLVQAETLNRFSDLYRTDIAQTNFALANAIAITKGPSESSPGGSLTEDDKKSIQQLLKQAIDEGRIATTLNPRSAANWETLGNIYKQISGVAENAVTFSLDAYGRAIQRDPYNPALRLNVGGIYYSLKNYELAVRFFTDAINIKPDYANGYYNLAVALRDAGNLQGSQAAAEQVASLVDPNSQDYKIAADFLSDLKSRTATGSAQQSPIKPSTSRQESALQQESLPQVLDLPQPETIATPAAIKRSDSSPTPTPTP